MAAPETPRVWVLADTRAGNRSQALGVADALGWPFERKNIAYTRLAGLPNVLLGAGFSGLTPASKESLTPPWPDLVVATGRRTAPVARAIKRRSGGQSRLLQIMDPGPGGRNDFDLIAVPAHDRPPEGAAAAPNEVIIPAAPHGLSEARLEAAALEWAPRLAHLPRPRIALLVGGHTRRHEMTPAMIGDLAGRTCRMAGGAGAGGAGAAVMATTSARTPAGTEDLLVDHFQRAGVPHLVHAWASQLGGDGDGDNPYPGYLACADAVVVTGESMSMCSEAAALGRPLFIFAPETLVSAKHARLHAALYDAGAARPLVEGVMGDWRTWTPEAMSSAALIARHAKALFG